MSEPEFTELNDFQDYGIMVIYDRKYFMLMIADRGELSYIYSAAGEKLAKKKKDNTYQYYAGNMVYNKDKLLDYLLFDEGLVNKATGGYTYEYHLKDYLGNTRVTFQPNGSTTTTTQVAEYYPFGSSYLPISPAGTNKYLYNGKLKRSVNPDLSGEKQDDVLGGTALDWYDYGARFYDPIVVRFTTLDPFAESYYPWSPYNYVGGNPIARVDENGEFWNYVIGAAVGAAVDLNGNGDSDIVGTEGSSKTATSVITDASIGVVTSVVSSKAGDALVSGSSKNAVKSAQSNVTAKAKNLTKSNNSIRTSDLKAKTTGGGQAFGEFSSAKQCLDVTKALNSTVGQVNDNIVRGTVRTTGGVVGQGAKDIIDDNL